MLEIIGKFHTQHSYELVINLKESICNQGHIYLTKISPLEYKTKTCYFVSISPSNANIYQGVRDEIHSQAITS